MGTRAAIFVLSVILLTANGCSWLHRSRVNETLPPIAFQQTPTIDDIVYAVHTNTRRVQNLNTESATLSLAGFPSLRANLVMEQPRNLRLRAQLIGLAGPELDIGSNNEEFWFWIKRSEPRAVLFARHAEFAQSAAKNVIPVEPEWIFEAIGLVNFDAGGTHTGPFPSGQGRYEVHSRIPTVAGELSKVTTIDEKYGWILEQRIRDPRGRDLAWARASNYRFYSNEAVSLPHHVDIRISPTEPPSMAQRNGRELPPLQIALQLDVGNYVINSQTDNHDEVWKRPSFEGYPPVNLAGPGFDGPTVPPSNYSPQNYPQQSSQPYGRTHDLPRAAYRVDARGFPSYR